LAEFIFGSGCVMSRVVKRSASQVIKISRPRRNVSSSVRSFSAFPARREATFGVTMGAWIKLVGWRMVARLDNGHAQLLTRAGPDWTGNYQSVTNLNVKTAYRTLPLE
jgi:ATP-dependent DNA ligase